MKTSTEIASLAKHVGMEKAIEMIAAAGFDSWDFSMFQMARYDGVNKRLRDTSWPIHSSEYTAYAKRLRQIGLDCGIRCNQSHAPFPVFVPEIRDLLKRSIEMTAIAGGEICVIHPDNFKSAEENAEMYFELLPFARECGVKIATENMWNWDKEADHATRAACSHHDDFVAHLDAVNDPYFVACLDIGHAEMYGLDTTARKSILALGDRLRALHVHDNDLRKDSHQLPFTMEIDFEDVIAALKEVNYKGYMTLEADAYLSKFDADTLATGVKSMADTARRLADMFEA